MGKLISASQAAELLGVSRQTIINWGESGILTMKKMGKSGNSWLLNVSELKDLSQPMVDVDKSRKLLESELKELQERKEEADRMIEDVNREIRLHRRFSNMFIATFFDINFIEGMRVLGVLKDREAEIMRMVVRGDSFATVAGELELTRTRVSQIFYKGCSKCGNIDGIRERLDEVDSLKSEIASLKSSYRWVKEENDSLRAKLGLQREERAKELLKESDNMFRLLTTKLVDLEISVRSLNGLKSANIETVGDLVQNSKTDILKIKNMGRKSLTELSDLIEMLGLDWSMDVERFFRERIERKMKDDTANDE